jgi:hypothetical protein
MLKLINNPLDVKRPPSSRPCVFPATLAKFPIREDATCAEFP